MLETRKVLSVKCPISLAVFPLFFFQGIKKIYILLIAYSHQYKENVCYFTFNRIVILHLFNIDRHFSCSFPYRFCQFTCFFEQKQHCFLNLNREIADMNRELWQTKARIKKVKTWLYAQPLSNPPTMVSIMSNIADAQNLDTQWKKISNLKTQAQVLIFLQQNHISDMAQLVGKVTQIGEDLQTVSDKIKKVDRRMNTLTQHLLQCENFKQHRSVYMKYKQLDPKKRDVFYDRHFEGIRLYESAKKYLDAVLNGRKKIPTKAWQSEQTKLTAERFSLCEDYYRLKDETHSVELLRKGAENIMRESSRNEPTVTKKRDMEL